MIKLPNRSNRIFLCCLVGLSWFFSTSQVHYQAHIDPRVLKDASEGHKTHFLVVFRQPDTRELKVLPGKTGDAHTEELINNLIATADTTQRDARAYLQKAGIRYTSYWVANAIAVEGDYHLAEILAGFKDVILIEPDRSFAVDLEGEDVNPHDLMGIQAPGTIEYNLTQVHAPDVWARGETGVGIVYAVADTGVYWQHTALINHYRGWDGASPSHAYNWWDAIHSDINGSSNPCGYSVAYPCDDYGHGTHVAGTGVGDDGGVHQIGMAPGARWIACRNMDSGVGRPSTYIECLQFFMAPTDLNGENPNSDLRADVISNSYGCPSSELCVAHSLQIAVENVRAAGIFMSVSAGNNGPNCGTISDPPALEASVFTIGAVDSSNTIAWLSSRGPVNVDGTPLMKPDLVAPGLSINSSLFTDDDDYGYKSGTSMAAPHIAGAVALLWGAFPSLRHDVDATETLLIASAQPLTTSQGCGGDGVSQVPNNVYGGGLLNVKAAFDTYWPIQRKYIFPQIYDQD
jgi:serine protease AprX